MREDRCLGIKEVEAGGIVCQPQVSVEEGLNGAYVFPVAPERVRKYFKIIDGSWNDIATEIEHFRVSQQLGQNVPIKQVNPHRGQNSSFPTFKPKTLQYAGRRKHLINMAFDSWFLAE